MGYYPAQSDHKPKNKKPMMKSPVTYADWVDIFVRFGKGEDVFEEMSSGHFDLDAGVAERFYAKAEEAYKTRKKMWMDNFQRSFKIQDIKTVEEMEFILQNNKKTLSALSKFIHSKGLPKEIKETFEKDFVGFVGEFKNNLKDNVQRDNKEREKMLMTINSFSINEPQQNLSIDKGQDSNSSTGKKIIF